MLAGEDERFASCWGAQDCRSCLKSKSVCGWCPYTSTCVPANSLLDPIKNPDICPHWAERWELRTKPLGCYCSTITLFSVLVTILCTAVGLVILFGIFRSVQWIDRVWGVGAWEGWSLKVDESGRARGSTWHRSKRRSRDRAYERLPD